MASQELGAVFNSVETLFNEGTFSAMADGELLERYLDRSSRGAEDAFSTLVDRHGPMVLRVCRGALQDLHEAEDAFQATFVILARRAHSIRKRGSVASWLYGVARRVARRARVERARRAVRERRGATMAMAAHPKGETDPQPGDLVPEVQEELDRLPEKYREAIILCYMEGLTHEQAAGQLRIPIGTVKVRLARGRERLRGKLVRRGLAPGVIAGVFSAPARGSIPTPLLNLTLKAAMPIAAVRAATISVTVAALVEGVLRAMFLAKLKTVGVLVATSLAVFLASALMISTHPRPVRSAQLAVAPEQAKFQIDVVKKADIEPQGKPGEVLTAPVKRTRFSRTTSQPGTVAAWATATLYSRVSGYVKSLHVDIGASVKQGEVLAEIEAPEVGADYQRSQAVVARARARIVKAETNIRIAEAAMRRDAARVKAARAELDASEASVQYRQKQQARTKKLLDDHQCEPRIFDEVNEQLHAATASRSAAQAGVIAAEAGLDGAGAGVEGAKGDLVEAQTDLQVARADMKKAEILMGYVTIKSPFDGRVTFRGCHVGEFVRSPIQGATTPLLTIVKTDTVRVIVAVPDGDAPYLDVGDRATVAIDALGGREYQTKVARIAEAEDANDRTLRTEIDLPNPDGRLRPGQFGRVTITLDERADVITIPRSALAGQPGSGTLGCYRVVGGRAAWTPIKLGEMNVEERDGGGEVEVVDGLKAGAIVVTNPRASRVAEGQEVRVEGREDGR